MKHVIAFFAASLLSLSGMAQKSALEGTWVMLDSQGFPTTSVKVFMPDGKQLGLSFNSDYTNSSVWFMSDYKMLNDTSYVDHAFYHSDIAYQRDYFFTFHKENDSILVSTYTDWYTNGRKAERTEKWKKADLSIPTYTNDEWQRLYLKSLAEFDRLPKEGQTVEQYAEELFDKSQGYKKSNKLDRTYEALLIRAELDTTNIQWQRDLLNFFLRNNAAPSMAEKIADRYIRLQEAVAPTPTDTSVVNAYRIKAYLYNYRGRNALEQVRELESKVIGMETSAGHQPSKDYGLDYFLMAMTYLPEGDFNTIYDYAVKAIDIFEKSTDVRDSQKAEGYYLKAMALMNTDRQREAIDVIMEKVVPLFVDEQGNPLPKVNNEVLPFVSECYNMLLKKNPKDKKLLKEFQDFMSDKLLCAVFEATNKEYNLWGEYYILEMDNWTVEMPAAIADVSHFLLQKDDQYVDCIVKENQKLGGSMRMIPVDAAKKMEVIQNYKAYKKNKK